jgi:hypothetical protein
MPNNVSQCQLISGVNYSTCHSWQITRSQAEHSRQPLSNQFFVDHGVTDLDESHRSSVAVNRRGVDLDHFTVPSGGIRRPQQKREGHEPRKS